MVFLALFSSDLNFSGLPYGVKASKKLELLAAILPYFDASSGFSVDAFSFP